MSRSNPPDAGASSDRRVTDSPADGIAFAIDLCNERGVRLTTVRRQVLQLLLERSRPTGAYELIEALKQWVVRPVAPPTVHRALEFLIAQGFVHKIESRSAYVVCEHPEHRHDCIFFICGDCGVSVELEDQRVADLLVEDATDRLGFSVTSRMVQVQGTCRLCTEADA